MVSCALLIQTDVVLAPGSMLQSSATPGILSICAKTSCAVPRWPGNLWKARLTTLRQPTAWLGLGLGLGLELGLGLGLG